MEIPYVGLFMPTDENKEIDVGLYPFDGVLKITVSESHEDLLPILASTVPMESDIPEHVRASEFGRNVMTQLVDMLEKAMEKNNHRLACLAIPYGEMYRFSFTKNDFENNPIVCDYMRSMKSSTVTGFKPALN